MDVSNITSTLQKLLDQLGLPYSDVTIAEEEGYHRIEIVSPSPSRIIGWHGETLNSLQHLLKSIVRAEQKLDRSPFLVLDIDGYRRDQEDKVRGIAEQKAEFVRKTGSRVALPPMSPFFRRVVHLHVANSPNLQDLTTESSGEGDYRQIVLRLKDESGAVTVEATSEDEELSPTIDDGLENLDI